VQQRAEQGHGHELEVGVERQRHSAAHTLLIAVGQHGDRALFVGAEHGDAVGGDELWTEVRRQLQQLVVAHRLLLDDQHLMLSEAVEQREHVRSGESAGKAAGDVTADFGAERAVEGVDRELVDGDGGHEVLLVWCGQVTARFEVDDS